MAILEMNIPKKNKLDTSFLMIGFACGGLHIVLLTNASFFLYLREELTLIGFWWLGRERRVYLYMMMMRRQQMIPITPY